MSGICRAGAAAMATAAALAAGACGGRGADSADPAASTTATASAARAPAPAAQGASFVRSLRAGGHLIAFRHARTDHSQDDAPSFRYRHGPAQRTLNDAGRAQAGGIGRAFPPLRTPVGRVLASRYCRAVQTARLA